MQMWTTFATNSRRDKEMTLTTARPFALQTHNVVTTPVCLCGRKLSAICRDHVNSNVIL